jgi:hypothetical protein
LQLKFLFQAPEDLLEELLKDNGFKEAVIQKKEQYSQTWATVSLTRSDHFTNSTFAVTFPWEPTNAAEEDKIRQ